MSASRNTLLTFLLLNFLFGSAQIDCYPRFGDEFSPISSSALLRTSPSLLAEIKIPSYIPEEIAFTCIEDGFTDGFVKLEIHFTPKGYWEYGINMNLQNLFEIVRYTYYDAISFSTFFNLLWDIDEMKSLYDYLYVNESEWLESENNPLDPDMFVFQNFYDRIIHFNRSESREAEFLNMQGAIVWVHKSHLKSHFGWYITWNGESRFYYEEKIQQLIESKNNLDCKFSEKELYSNLESLCHRLMDDTSNFQAIKKIAEVEQYIDHDLYHFRLLFLRMEASYYDGNYIGALNMGQELINASKQNKFHIHPEESYYDNYINMSMVYRCVISSLLTQENYSNAILLSTQCLLDNELQFFDLERFHAMSLYHLNKKKEACEFLNKAYIKGDEVARNLIKEMCN